MAWNPKRSKYKAVRTVVDGHSFPSKKEAKRYGELKVMMENGDITGLKLQPKFPIFINDIKVFTYLADFWYEVEGKVVVEDVKGMKTPMYRLKKKCVEAYYNCEITET